MVACQLAVAYLLRSGHHLVAQFSFLPQKCDCMYLVRMSRQLETKQEKEHKKRLRT